MRITRTISSADPSKCHMIAKGFFGTVKGEVKYADYPVQFLGDRPGYFILKSGEMVGAATDFFHACDSLLNELGVVKTTCV